MTVAPAWEFPGTERFQVIRRIGSGAMGAVYEVADGERGQRLALKAIRNPDAELIYRLKNEFRALADLAHPNLVALHELFVEGATCFFTMELVEGAELGRYLAPQRSSEDTIPPGELGCDEARLRQVLPQLAEGLAALHRAGKIHRDVKPSNILVTPAGRLVLCDFGLVVHEQEPEQVTQSGRPVGTIAYMAPEQAHGEARLTPAADWYALGVVLYEALTGMVPFSGPMMEVLVDKQRLDPPPPRARVPRVPRDLDGLCVDLLARDPAARPGADEVLRRLGVARPRARPSDGSRGSLAAPFAGREAELATLEASFAALRDGRPAAVLLRGPSGMGKSTLLGTFLERARAGTANLVVLEGRCYEREVVAYRAMDSVVDRLSHFWMTLPPGEAQALMPREGSLLPRLFPVLGRVPAVAEAPPARHVGDPQDVRTRAFAALREVLQRLGDRRRLVLVLDDLQWVDSNTMVLLADLLRPPDPPLLLLVLATRVEGSAPLEALLGRLGVEHALVEVGPLAPEAALSLSRQHLGAERQDLAARIAHDAAGNPFFIAELAQYARARGTAGLEASASPSCSASASTSCPPARGACSRS